MKKLTLSASDEVIAQAHKLARDNGTSISAMFDRMIRSLAASTRTQPPLTPLARKASGLISLPRGKTARQVLEDALLEKHGLDQ